MGFAFALWSLVFLTLSDSTGCQILLSQGEHGEIIMVDDACETLKALRSVKAVLTIACHFQNSSSPVGQKDILLVINLDE